MTLRALVTDLLAHAPRAAPSPDVAPLLDAGIADVLRACDDLTLLRLCAPALRDLLAADAADDASPSRPAAPVAAPCASEHPEPPDAAPVSVERPVTLRPLPKGYGSREVYGRHLVRVRKRHAANRAAWLAEKRCTRCGGERDAPRSPCANRDAPGVRCAGCRETAKVKVADRAERRECAA